MTTLSDIIKDPNYTGANAATKRAIFDKFAATDPNYTGANAETQNAIRLKFGVGDAPAAPPPPDAGPKEPIDQIPGQVRRPAPPEVPVRNLTTWDKVRGVVGPTVEALGAVGGGIVGAGAGTVLGGPGVGTLAGGVGGSGLGYSMAKEALRIGDTFFGSEKPPERDVLEPARNVLEGAALEAGGRVAMPLIAKGVGKIADLGSIATQKGAKIARESIGHDPKGLVLNDLIARLRGAPQGVTAAQATGDTINPAWQALNRRMAERTPESARYYAMLEASQKEASENALAQLAGGGTSTAVRTTTETAKKNLNTITGPMREEALKRANLGKAVAGYETQAGQLADDAAAQVERVRTLESAKGKAVDAYYKYAADPATGVVAPTQQATHMGNLAKDAERWADGAAKGSLDLGQGARFAQAAADSLRTVGVKPLESAPLIDKLVAIKRNPSFAENDLIEGAVDDLAKGLTKWTNGGGVIDARALDAIRKNAVNATIARLRPGMDATAQRNAAASVMTEVKPLITKAIEDAGGTGYSQYLAEHAKGMQRIAEKKLVGKAAELFKSNKDAFVELVQGNSPKEVEKILGPGNYDIAKEVSENTMEVLREQARQAIRNASMSSQATRGEAALKKLMEQNISFVRLPSYLSFWFSTANKTLDRVEESVGRRTLQHLTEALKNPKTAADLLSTLPATERTRILKILNDPALYSQAKTAAVIGAKNALTPENNNALAE